LEIHQRAFEEAKEIVDEISEVLMPEYKHTFNGLAKSVANHKAKIIAKKLVDRIIIASGHRSMYSPLGGNENIEHYKLVRDQIDLLYK